MKGLLAGLASLLLGAAVGYLAFAWAGPALLGEAATAPDGPGLSTGLKLLLIPTTLAVVVGILAVHELGHVAGGRAVGFRFLLLIVGPLKVMAGRDRLHWGLNRSLALAGGLAACAPRAGDRENLPGRMAVLVAGGPLASLLLGLGGLGLRAIPGLGQPVTQFGVFWNGVLLIVSVSSLAIALMTLIPARTAGFATDGARLLQLLRDDDEAAAQSALVTITGWTLGGVRPREWDPAVVAQATETRSAAFRGVALHSAWRHALDRAGSSGDPADPPEVAELRQRLLEAVEDIPESIRGAVYRELATDRALAGDVRGAEGLLDRAGKVGAMEDAYVDPLARAAVALARGSTDGVEELLGRAEAEVSSSMDAGGFHLDRERILLLRQRLAEVTQRE